MSWRERGASAPGRSLRRVANGAGRLAGAILAIGFVLSAAHGAASPFMPEANAAAPAPPGFFSFCLRFADQCATRAPARIVLTPQALRTIEAVNRAVNAAIWPEDDMRHYGRAEYWTIPTDGYGDCDDYALAKRKELTAAGLPASALRLALAETREGERHAVLTVATDRGDFVLDNLSDNVVPWNALSYRWIERQDAADPMKWGTAPDAAAATSVIAK